MLQYLHEKVQGWLAWAVVGIVASTFVLFGASYYVGARSSNTVKATVNGSDVSRYAFDTTYRRLKQQAGNLNATSEAILKNQALEQLVLENIMLSTAKDNGFSISKTQAESAILLTPDFQEDGVFSSQRFQQILANNQFSQTDYLKIMTNGMMNNQVRFSFIATSFILQNELEAYVQYANQKRNYNYLVINPENLLLKNVPTESDYKKYYNAHKSLFMTPETVSLNYVLLSMKDELLNAKLEDNESKTYYDDNKSNFMVPARFQIKRIFIKFDTTSSASPRSMTSKKIKDIQSDLKASTFEKVSEKYSDDLFSEKDSISWVTLTSLDKKVSKELVNLSVGKVSEPIITEHGIEFIKLMAKKEAKLTPFEKVRPSLEKNLLSEKAQRNFQQKAEQLADLSYQNPDDLMAVAEPLSLKVSSSALSTKEKGFAVPLSNALVLEAAFSDDVLKERNNSQPIQLNDDMLVVVRVNKHINSQLKPFSDVKSEIQSTLITKRQAKQAYSLAESIKAAGLKGQKVIMDKNKLSWHKVGNALRTFTDSASEQINQAAFSISSTKMKELHLKKLPNNELALIKLEEIENGLLKDVSLEHRSLLNNQLASNYGINSYDLYIQLLKKQAKVIVLN